MMVRNVFGSKLVGEPRTAALTSRSQHVHMH